MTLRGLVLALVVLVVGTLITVTGLAAQDAADGRPAQGVGTALGPPEDADVDAWFAAAQARATKVSGATPELPSLALVSLTRTLTPPEAVRLAGGTGLQTPRAYLRAPVSAGLPEELSVEVPADLASTLEAIYEATAARKTRDTAAFLELATSIGAAGDQDARQTAVDAAALSGQEADAYATGCACVFALVVEGPAATLARLRAQPEVRGVELAARGASLLDLQVDPLAPSATGGQP